MIPRDACGMEGEKDCQPSELYLVEEVEHEGEKTPPGTNKILKRQKSPSDFPQPPGVSSKLRVFLQAHKYTGSSGAPRVGTGAAEETSAGLGRCGPRTLRGNGIYFGVGLVFFPHFAPLKAPGDFPISSSCAECPRGAERGQHIRPAGPVAETGQRGRKRNATESRAVPALSAATSG